MRGPDGWRIEIIKRTDSASGFTALPRRRVSGRTDPWLARSRRLARDCEATTAGAEAWLRLADMCIFIRRLDRRRATPV